MALTAGQQQVGIIQDVLIGGPGPHLHAVGEELTGHAAQPWPKQRYEIADDQAMPPARSGHHIEHAVDALVAALGAVLGRELVLHR